MTPRRTGAKPVVRLRQLLDFAGVYGAGEKSRTPDLRITNALLYQLSYAGVACADHRSGDTAPEKPRFYPTGAGDFSSNGASFFGTATFFSVTYTGMPRLYFG